MKRSFKLSYRLVVYISLTILVSCNHPLDLPSTPEGFYTDLRECECQIGQVYTNKHIPNSYSIDGISYPKNQYNLGLCAVFATSACAEHQHKRSFSEAEFTVLVQTITPWGDKCRDTGIFLGKTLEAARKFGLVDESCLDYRYYLKYVDENESSREDKLCIPGDYNGTMAKIGVNLNLAGISERSDITSYGLIGIHAIHHISERSIKQAINGKLAIWKMQSSPGYQLKSVPTTTYPSISSYPSHPSHTPLATSNYPVTTQIPSQRKTSRHRGSTTSPSIFEKYSAESDIFTESDLASSDDFTVYPPSGYTSNATSMPITTTTTSSWQITSDFSSSPIRDSYAPIQSPPRSVTNSMAAMSISSQQGPSNPIQAPPIPQSYIGEVMNADISSIESALVCNFPVAMALNVYQRCWNPNEQNGFKIEMPTYNDLRTEPGSHAVVITGYNKGTKLFKIKNSWGIDWGDRGFAYIPYDYVKDYSTELIAVTDRFFREY